MMNLHATLRGSAPSWAASQLQVIELLKAAAIEFCDRYTRADGTLIWQDHWPGMDGSDDPYEGFQYMPLLYSLTGYRPLLERSRLIWDSITWQWTQYGQIHDEFDAYYDWMHHGEGSLYLYFLGLADPTSLKDKTRARKFAKLYCPTDGDEAINYDAALRLIKSPITGSLGPRHLQTKEDWLTHRPILSGRVPPFEDLPGIDPESSACDWNDDATYHDIIKRINERQAKGDVPVNLCSTSMATHAFMYTGDTQFADWVISYLDAWKERAEANGGLMPDNVGLSGIVGEYNGGKWWGGYYGWRWPHGSLTILEPTCIACANATLLTGDTSHLDLARKQLDLIWSMRIDEGGRAKVPARHFDDGWRDYRAFHPMYAIHLWILSQDPADADRAWRSWDADLFGGVSRAYHSDRFSNGNHLSFNANIAPWFEFVQGRNDDYPDTLLAAARQTINDQLAAFRSADKDPWKMDHESDPMSIHMWQQLSPLVMEPLIQLMCGGPMHLYHGGLQYCSLRYFDCETRAAGLPQGVAALVSRVENGEVEVTFFNSSQNNRSFLIQAGSFGEHEFRAVSEPDCPVSECKERYLSVSMTSESIVTWRLKTARFVHRPSYTTPFANVSDIREIVPRFSKR